MAQAALFYEDQVVNATLTASSAAITQNNLKTYQPGEKWRSTTNAAQWVRAAWSDSQFLPMVLVWRHNLSAEATIRIRISDSSDMSSPSYDATFYAWPSLYGYDQDTYDVTGYDGAPDLSKFQDTQFYSIFVLNLLFKGTAISGGAGTIVIPATLTNIGEESATSSEDDFYAGYTIRITAGTGSGQERSVASYAAGTRTITVDTAWSTPPDSTSQFEIDLSEAISVTENDDTYLGAYLRIDIEDNAQEASYLEAGRLMAGDYFKPGIDIDPPSYGFVDPSERFKSYGQNTWLNRRNKYRVADFSFGYLTETEAKVDMFNLAAVAGASQPIVYIPFLENSFRAYTDTIYGLLSAPPRIEQVRKDYTHTSYRVSLSIEELL
jgi:hypothetical protein